MHNLAFKRCPACSTRASDEHRFCPGCGADLAQVQVTSGDPYVGLVLADRYELESLLGEGAMGRVYRARQTALNKPFAVKILHPHLTHDTDSQNRFAAEAHNAASLNHPNVVSVVDYGRSPEGITYLVMEHVEGRSLEEIIAEEFPLGRVRTIDLTLQILAALTEAHGLNVLHRDLKPENILIQSLRTHGELLKVLDFGIAKLMDAAPGSTRAGLTSQGVVCGTPEFMSPEQARGLDLDGRSDLYAVGVILYQMLAGRVPFESEAAVDVLHRHIHEEPIPPSQVIGAQADALEDVCLRALSKDRDSRFATAAEFRDALVAANEAETSDVGMHCGACNGQIRHDDRFCAACGQPVVESANGAEPPSARPPGVHSRSRLSTISLQTLRDEPTAKVILRALPLPLVGRPLIADMQLRLTEPGSGLHSQLISGTSGMGKTRMLDEVAHRAKALGWQVIRCDCDPTGAARSLWPIRKSIAAVLRLDAHSLTTEDLGRATNVIGLSYEALPGLTELFGLNGPASSAEHAVRRRECFTSAVQTMVAAGGSTPLCLLFDDIDRFDAPSRQILQQLTRTHAERPVFLALASSESDLSWLQGPVERLEMLGSAEIESAIGDSTAGFRAESSLPAHLAKGGAASPLRLDLLLRAMATDRDIDASFSDEALLERRLAALDEVARRLLDAAAILGERCATAEIRTLVAAELTAAMPVAIDEGFASLHHHGLLVQPGEQGQTRAFPNRLIRETVLSKITTKRRRHLHAEAASKVQSILESNTVRAMHMLRGGGAEVLDVLERSAIEAEHSFDDNKAVSLYRAAIRVCNSTPAGDRTKVAKLVKKLARPLRHVHGEREVISMIREVLPSTDDPTLEGALQRELGMALLRCDDAEAAVRALQRALGPVIAGGDQETILDLYGELSGALLRTGQATQALVEAHEGLDMCTLGQGPRAPVDVNLWRYLLQLAGLYKRSGNLRKARTWCEHALFQAEQRSDPLGLLRSHAQMAWLLRDLGQNTLAEQHLARSLEHARHFGDRLTTAEILLERARHWAGRDRLDDAKRCLDEALRLALIVGWNEGITLARSALRGLLRNDPLVGMREPTSPHSFD